MMKQSARQILFWAFLGPFMFILTSFIAWHHSHTLLPCLSLGGLLISYRYKVPGLIFTLSSLTVAALFNYTWIPLEEKYWFVGLYMAYSLSFVITALSAEEAEEMIHAIEIESESRLETVRHLDEKLKRTQLELQAQTQLIHFLKETKVVQKLAS